jgi:hypothetical protein
MSFFTYFDENAWEPAVVQEWLEEVRNATVHYLGGGTPAGGSEGAHAKL